MHKFCHSGAEPALRGKLRVQESHVIQRNKIKEIHVKDIFQSHIHINTVFTFRKGFRNYSHEVHPGPTSENFPEMSHLK